MHDKKEQEPIPPVQAGHFTVSFEEPDQSAVHELIGELDAYLYSLYPG